MTDWRDQATCRPGNGYDPRTWFETRPAMVQLAQRICDDICPVQDQCLYAGRDERNGVWGGHYRLVKDPGPSPSAPYLTVDAKLRGGA